MFGNFFKVSIRNLVRNKTYSLINILGLSIGMACSIVIFLFIFDELSYDKYHENADSIYRLGIDAQMQGNRLQGYVTGAPVGSTFVNEIPEIINSTRVITLSFGNSGALVEKGDKKLVEEKLFFVDSSFFDIFTIEFKGSAPLNVLNSPYTLVLTESAANKYFNNENPVGKSLTIQNQEYMVQGVIKDCPSNSHFHYSILASMLSLPVANSQSWMSNDYSYTYVQISPNADIVEVRRRMMESAKKYIEPELQAVFGVTVEDFVNAGNSYEYILQPLTDIHLKSHTDYELEANSNIVYIYVFSIIAIFILFIAIINFMNLSTARSATRAKEVGIRKVIGAFRISLFKQFLLESVVMSFISLIIGMVIIESVLPTFNNFTLKQLSIGYFSNAFVLPSLILLAIIVGVLSGVYSATYLSSTKILNVIKGKVLSGTKHKWFRSFLVIFQFSVSITLFICTFLIYSQLNLLRTKDIGFDKKDILVLNIPDEIERSFDSFKEELEAIPFIQSVSASSTLPSRSFGGLPLTVDGDPSNKSYAPRVIAVDSDFKDTYKLELIEGRFFSEDLRTDTFSILLNESAVNEFGLQDPVGKYLITNFFGNVYNWKIIGVVKNFNFRSLHQEVGSLIISTPFLNGINLTSIKLNTEISEDVLKTIKGVWEKFCSEEPFDYDIMEDDFDNMHSEEFRTGDVFTVFSILAIFIACLGLFGLASFLAEQKTKEIGIRKAMGASTFAIVKLLLVQFTKWVVWANLIAWPVAYFLMKNWLQNFAYQVNIQWWLFVLSGVLGLLIAILTVGFQAIKAARSNPVNSLRYE